ncbi:hypothetical protein CK203_117216 [Vitis vinifera]|uniref:Uncharacterized protein n=1 Tax=Vitis vinifera TaxID=29760 RepID=A0A438DFQ4_VITVI|nr:hypothetical protein CK203_117216 [Vitis vinifera]
MSKHSSNGMAELYSPSFPQLGAEWRLRLLRFFLWRRRWHRDGTGIGIGEGTGVGTGDGIGEGSGDCSVKSMGSELSTLGLFCDGRPPDLVRYRFAGGFAARASLEEELLSAAKAQKRDPELAPFAGSSCDSKEMKI